MSRLFREIIENRVGGNQLLEEFRIMSARILIVDDEAAIRDMVRMALESEGFDVADASNAHQAGSMLNQDNFDLILLDWMMPGISGIDFAGRIRREGNHNIGIIMLTARDDEHDLLRGLSIGADDYVKKPFSTKELISRIHAVLRRISTPTTSTEIITAGRITIDLEQHRVKISGKSIDLSPTEFRLLHFLCLTLIECLLATSYWTMSGVTKSMLKTVRLTYIFDDCEKCSNHLIVTAILIRFVVSVIDFL